MLFTIQKAALSRSKILSRFEPGSDIGDVLLFKSKLRGAEHQRAVKASGRFDLSQRNPLGESAHALDHEGIAAREHATVNRGAAVGKNFVAIVTVCDVSRRINYRRDESLDRLLTRPGCEIGAVVNSSIVDAMTH